jgi:hypothetical protein
MIFSLMMMMILKSKSKKDYASKRLVTIKGVPLANILVSFQHLSPRKVSHLRIFWCRSNIYHLARCPTCEYFGVVPTSITSQGVPPANILVSFQHLPPRKVSHLRIFWCRSNIYHLARCPTCEYFGVVPTSITSQGVPPVNILVSFQHLSPRKVSHLRIFWCRSNIYQGLIRLFNQNSTLVNQKKIRSLRNESFNDSISQTPNLSFV